MRKAASARVLRSGDCMAGIVARRAGTAARHFFTSARTANCYHRSDLLRCQMRLLGLKITAVVLFALAVLAAPTSDGSWRELGPHFSGRVSAIAVRNANEM